MPKATNKPAGKFKVSGGKKGGMHTFEGVGPQKPGGTAVNKSGTSGKFAKGGPSGKMHKFTGVSAQVPGQTAGAARGGRGK